MKKRLVFLLISFFFITSAFAITNRDSLNLYIPKGQISGRYFKVFLREKALTIKMSPKLILKRVSTGDDIFEIEAAIVAANQPLAEEIDGKVLYSEGTWLYFNLNKINMPFFCTTLEILPIILWQNKINSDAVTMVYSGNYFLGHGMGTVIWTVLVMLFFFSVLIGILRYKNKTPFLGIICKSNGRMSMSLLQMGLWTIVIGSMVLAFGLLRLEVPDIPANLILLMFFAAVTTTVGQFQTRIKQLEQMKIDKIEKPKAKDNKKNADKSVRLKFSTVFYSNENDEYPSLSKIQVLFWTVISIVLFVYLSINEASLWEVPDELVFLMGISQATFLSRQQLAIQEIKDERKSLGKNIKEK